MLDLGAMKGSLVGQSEQQIRSAIKVIKAVAGKGGAFFIATCNDLTVLPPELRRRYKYGIWFFDLPDKKERESIWKVCLAQFGLTGPKAQRTFDDDGWTGAEIRNVCELAWKLNQPLDEARLNIVPISISDSGRIERLRDLAKGKFLSASYPGPYRSEGQKVEALTTRMIYGED
jgi:SpoVK/Ycf46/Vps4 family AAA+-type ATPase